MAPSQSWLVSEVLQGRETVEEEGLVLANLKPKDVTSASPHDNTNVHQLLEYQRHLG